MKGGSTMPTLSEFWQDTIITDYIDPATGGNYTPVLVPTPESGASTSLPVGLADLQAAMAQQPADQPYLSRAIRRARTIDEKVNLMQAGSPPPDVTFLLLGSGNRPDGGFLERFPGLVIPGAPGLTSMGPSRPMPAFPPSTSRTSTTVTPISRSTRSTWSPT